MARLAALDASRLPQVPKGSRIGACVGSVGKVVCIRLNHADHAAEAGLKPPGQPIVFNKHNGAISGPTDDVWLPPGAQKHKPPLFLQPGDVVTLGGRGLGEQRQTVALSPA